MLVPKRKIAIPLAFLGVLAATAALAQQPAPPSPPGAPGPAAGSEPAAPPPPPPGGPLADRPPAPPPPGVHVMLDRDANGVVRVDVHCAQQDTTKDCAAIATRLLAETSAAPNGR